MKSILLSVITGFIAALFCALPASEAHKVRFSIVYTNDVMGEVDPCG